MSNIDETRKHLLNEITDSELESLNCPTIDQQIQDWNRLTSLLTESKIRALIESLNYEMISFNHHSKSSGIINNIYFIECKEKQHPFSGKKFVLKITNPFESWKKVKTTHEVSVTKLLKQNTTIPVPEIITFSNDSETSPLNCEFILMEFLSGKLLEEVLPKKAHELPQTIVDQFVDILTQLKNLRIESNKIGRFDENMNIISTESDCKVSDNFLELVQHRLNFHIDELNKLNKFKKLAQTYKRFSNELVKKVNENLFLDKLNFNDKMSLCHTDLNPTNILIDENTLKITGIIDWEWSEYGFDDDQLDFFKQWYSDKEEKEIIKQKMTQVYAQNFEKMNGKEIRRELKKILEPLWSATFYLHSYFSHWDFAKYKWSNDVNLNVRMHIDDEANKAEENIEKLSNFLDKLSNYKL